MGRARVEGRNCGLGAGWFGLVRVSAGWCGLVRVSANSCGSVCGLVRVSGFICGYCGRGGAGCDAGSLWLCVAGRVKF